MLEGITRTVAQLAHLSPAKAGATPNATAFSSVIHREQPSPPAPTAGGPLSAQAARSAQQPTATEPAAPGLAERSLRRIVHNQRSIERSMRRALHGADFSPQELLALQMQVQKYSVEVEAVSRVVDRVAGGVKTAMQTQI